MRTRKPVIRCNYRKGKIMKHCLLATKYSLAIMLVCLAIFILNRLLMLNVEQWGIAPRTIEYLPGILIAPFLHVSWTHLLSNFFPFIVLGTLVGLQGMRLFSFLFLFFILSTGLLVWLFARGNSVHLGMSGVIYAFWGYLLVYGFVRREMMPLFISLVTLFLYGGLVFGVLPVDVSVSFESHFMGAMVGAVTGYRFAKRSV